MAAIEEDAMKKLIITTLSFLIFAILSLPSLTEARRIRNGAAVGIGVGSLILGAGLGIWADRAYFREDQPAHYPSYRPYADPSSYPSYPTYAPYYSPQPNYPRYPRERDFSEGYRDGYVEGFRRGQVERSRQESWGGYIPGGFGQ